MQMYGESKRYDPYDPDRYVQILNRPLVCAKGGGGSTSGKVDYPSYLKGMHGLLMTGDDQDYTISGSTPDTNMFAVLSAATGASPYTGVSAYDPAAPLAAMLTAIEAYDTYLGTLDYPTEWATNYDAAATKVVIPTTAIDAYKAILDTLNSNTNWGTYKNTVKAAFDTILTNPDKLETLLDTLSYRTDWVADLAAVVAAYDASVVPAAYLEALVTAHGNVLYGQIDETVMPKFKGGMRDIGAVMTNSFVIGQSLVYNSAVRDVAKFQAELGLDVERTRSQAIIAGVGQVLEALKISVDGTKEVDTIESMVDIARAGLMNPAIGAIFEGQRMINEGNREVAMMTVGKDSSEIKGVLAATEMMSRGFITGVEGKKMIPQMTMDANRIKIVATQAQDESDLEIDVKDALWDIELFAHAGNMLAAIGGGTSTTKTDMPKSSPIAGALGGAAAGAMAGAMEGGPGMGVGAVLGATAGFFMSM